MHPFTDLGTRTDRRPRVDHRTLTDIGSNVDIRRHHNHSRSQISSVTGRCLRNNPHPKILIFGFQFKLIVELHRSRFGYFELLDREIENHGLFHPLVHLPCAIGQRFCRTDFPFIEPFNHLSNTLFDPLFLQQIPVFPSLFDNLFYLLIHL